MFDKLKGLFSSKGPENASASGMDLMREGRFEAKNGAIARAIECYEEAIKRDSTLSEAMQALGDLLVMQGRDDDALPHLERAVAMDATMQEAHYQIGRIYLRRKDLARATRAFEAELLVTPRYGRVHNDLAVAYYQQKMYARAIEHADKAVALGEPVHDAFLSALAPHRQKK